MAQRGPMIAKATDLTFAAGAIQRLKFRTDS